MKNRIAAALLAFFLGSLGIHKFYLGKNVEGVLYLLFSWTFIPAILALFDFIGLLITSDEVFDARHNPKTRLLLASRTAQDITAAIADLQRLYEIGAVTAEEYEVKRQKLLGEL
jgi:TM2 domain-containing membrane protein YozV